MFNPLYLLFDFLGISDFWIWTAVIVICLRILLWVYENKNKSNNANLKVGEWSANGTGFFISKSGCIVTNFHVIEGASSIGIEFKYKGKKVTLNAVVLKSDKVNDLAILKIADYKFKGLENDIPYKIPKETRTDLGVGEVGSEVFALGYPMALDIMGKDIKFTDGRISSRSGHKGDKRHYQSTTPLQGGNSGGPLFDFNGNLIGINTSHLHPYVAENVSYSIKSSFLSEMIDSLDEKITFTISNNLKNKLLKEQIKILREFVVLVKLK
tara:strand:- start:994 stop:1797 length:804 start_codon:yes stop_codon:yes gene_type:complete